jgi:HlyD family secretion protein
MKTWKKVALAVAGVLVIAAVVGFSVQQSRKGVVKVQTGKVTRQDLVSQVTASGEIKPKTYVNVGANAFGKITRIFVKEGDRVKRGQVLAQLENVQPEADVQATKAALNAAQTDYVASQEAYNTAVADLERAKADLEQKQLDWQRGQKLYDQQLIPKSDYDTRKAAYEASASGLAQARTKIAQAKAQAEGADKRIAQQKYTLRRLDDVLSKTVYVAPFDGVVTNLPVREGETVVVGIQNSPGSTLMTLADNSVITAEVKVDETDIVSVKLGQQAEVTIDAIPKKKFKGVVTEIGNNALLRSTGVATSQTTSSSQEAKDFKVVITLQEPPENLRPGLSTTAKITTASKPGTLSIPIQALTVRQRADLEPPKKKGTVEAASSKDPKELAKQKEELQGVFVIRNGKAEFVQVDTGVTGTTDIEVLNGLKEGDEIVTGSYKVLRTLKSGASIKIDNSATKKEEEKS